MPNWTEERVVIGGRQVKLRDGRVTQTVNVRGSGGIEWKVRLDQPGVTLGELTEFKEVADLLKWLVLECGGDLEIGTLPAGPVQEDPTL